jgi:hypothetical protein
MLIMMKRPAKPIAILKQARLKAVSYLRTVLVMTAVSPSTGTVQMTQNIQESMLCRPSLCLCLTTLHVRSWGFRQKWGAIIVVSAFTFISPVSSSMIAPASEQLAENFDIHSTVMVAMTVSVFVLGYGGYLSFPHTVYSVQNLFIVFFPSYHSIWSVIPWPAQ